MNKNIKIILIALILLLANYSLIFSQEIEIFNPIRQNGGVTGKVISDDGPLSGALVTLSNGTSSMTGPEGEYSINDLKPGVYSIQISKDGFNPAHGTVKVVQGEVKSVLIKLSPDTAAPNNMQISNPNFEEQKPRYRQEQRVNDKPRYTTMTIKVHPSKDLTGGFKNYGKFWWVYSIKVEDKTGSKRWSESYSRPYRGDGEKELICRDAILGKEYRIEIEWRGFRDSKTRYWTKKLEYEDQVFDYDSPLGY